MTNKKQNTTDHNRQAKAKLRHLAGKKPTKTQINTMIKRKTNWAEYNKSWKTIEALTASFMPTYRPTCKSRKKWVVPLSKLRPGMMITPYKTTDVVNPREIDLLPDNIDDYINSLKPNSFEIGIKISDL